MGDIDVLEGLVSAAPPACNCHQSPPPQTKNNQSQNHIRDFVPQIKNNSSSALKRKSKTESERKQVIAHFPNLLPKLIVMQVKQKHLQTLKLKTTMTKNENATVVETTTAETTAVETIKAKVVNLIFNEDTDRVSIVTDTTFDTIKMGANEESETNSFGLHIFNLVNQIKDSVEIISIADAFNTSVNEILNPTILKLSLVGADIEFARKRVEKGEERENGDVYSNDGFTTTITKVVANVSAMKQQMLFGLLQSKPTIPSRKARMTKMMADNLNPFNI